MKNFFLLISILFYVSIKSQTAFDMNVIKKQNDTIIIPNTSQITFTFVTGTSATTLKTAFDVWKTSNPNTKIYFTQLLVPNITTRELYIIYK